MADIELVIKLEEETYNRIMNGWMPLHKAVNLMENVQKGTPLPKGHGKIIDSNEFNRYLISRNSSFKALIAEIPPIIEADKESKE